MEDKKAIVVRVSPEKRKMVKQIALDEDISVQDYILSLINADIKKRKKGDDA